MENQSKKQSLQSIPKHARQFVKVYNTSIRNALKREINAYLQNKKQKKEFRDALKRKINVYLQYKKRKKEFRGGLKGETNAYLQNKKQKKEFRDALKREIKAYLENKKQIKINNELKQIRLSKLVNKNISESDLVNIKELNAIPIKTLRQIAKLREILMLICQKVIQYMNLFDLNLLLMRKNI